MKIFKIFGMSVFALLAWGACSDDDDSKNKSDLPVFNVTFEQASVAFYQGDRYNAGSGNYVIRMQTDDIMLQLDFESSLSEDVNAAFPEAGNYSPAASTGSHTAGHYNLGGNATYWTAEGIKYLVKSGDFTIAVKENICHITGEFLSEEGAVLQFSFQAALQFRYQAVSDKIGFTFVSDARYQTVQDGEIGAYRLELTDDSKEYTLGLVFFDQLAADSQQPLPAAGNYAAGEKGATVAGTFRPGDAETLSYWKDKEGLHPIVSGTFSVAYENVFVQLKGTLTSEDGKTLNFGYQGKLDFPGEEASYNLYTNLSGTWQIQATDWLVYNKDSKAWEFGGAAPDYTGKLMGDNKNRLFYGSGFWDMYCGFLMDVKSDKLVISTDPTENPVAMVTAGLKQYVLFITLYDPHTGYLLSAGKEIELSWTEDYGKLTVKGVKGQVTDSETGDLIDVNYEYMGVIGTANGSSYTLFSNWSFAYLPTLEKVEGQSEASQPFAFEKNKEAFYAIRNSSENKILPVQFDTLGAAKISEILTADEIERITFLR